MLQLGFGRTVPKDPRLNIGTGEMSTLSPAVYGHQQIGNTKRGLAH